MNQRLRNEFYHFMKRKSDSEKIGELKKIMYYNFLILPEDRYLLKYSKK